MHLSSQHKYAHTYMKINTYSKLGHVCIMRAYTIMRIYICMYVCMRTLAYTLMILHRKYARISSYDSFSNKWVWMLAKCFGSITASVCMCMYVYMYMCMHIVFMRIHTYVHTHTHDLHPEQVCLTLAKLFNP